jgi:predicted nucleotidyltransferase component of viral defense system
MLSTANLAKFTKQAQTNLENVVREYCQHLFLSYLYKQPGSEKLLFKGGTALRIIFHSPRYSEDIDFTGVNIKQSEVENIFTDTLASVEYTGTGVELIEGKNTTGGYLGIAAFKAYGKEIPIQVEVSLRRGKNSKGTRTIIENDYIPAFSLIHLPAEKIVAGKFEALINREKPRDFYDFYFILRHRELRSFVNKNSLKKVKDILIKKDINFKKELSALLPASHQLVLKDFKNTLIKELERQ